MAGYMRRNSFAALAFSLSVVLFSLSYGSSAQTVSTPARSTGAITPLERDLRRHIEYLASDKLEGRRTGEPGAALAMEYVASQFKALKLRSPSGLRSGTFAQEFPYVTGVEAGAGNEFKLYYID